jgi:hypothetical protein
MATYSKLGPAQKLLSQNSVVLPNGNTLVTEVIQTGSEDFITGTILVDTKGVAITSVWCGTCGGQSVGCVDCPRNDPVLDCPNRRIYCAS